MSSATPPFTIKRDGSVVLDGVAIGSVAGEPRDWWFMLADPRRQPSERNGPWHSKREAGEMCVSAHRKRY